MSGFAVRWSDDAEKDVRRLDPVNQRRVMRVLLRFAEAGEGEVKRLQGPFGSEFRLRSGNLRIRFSIESESTIVILRVLPVIKPIDRRISYVAHATCASS